MLKITDALKKAAAKCTVRESDEERPGHFVAYVDEGTESYDVALELDAGRNPLSGRCDCEAKKPCRHMAALFLFVLEGRTATVAAVAPAMAKLKKAKSKQTPAEALLDTIPAHEISAWLLEIFGSNKDLELAFVNRFGAAADPNPEEVRKMSAEAVRTVMGRKRTPDSTQIAKLLQLWKNLFRPIVERYRSAPVSRDAYEALSSVTDSIMEFAAVHPGTGRLQKYARQMMTEFATQVGMLKQDEAFFQAAAYPLSALLRQHPAGRIVTLDYLQALAATLSGARLQWLAESIGSQFLLHAESRSFATDVDYRLTVLKILRLAGVFRDYADAFQARISNPELNIALIEAWTEAGMFEAAEEAAWTEIDRNTKEAHNAPYFKLLQAIYTANGNKEALANLLRQRLPETFDFDDYLLVLEPIPEASERREFRNRLFTLARNVKTPAADSFVLRLAVHEGDWPLILAMVAYDELPYEEITRHFERMFEHNPEELLRSLMQRRDWDSMYAKDQDSLRTALEDLVSKVMVAYDREALTKLVTSLSIAYQTRAGTNLFRRGIIAALKGSA